jgi:hypothetical protein
MRCLQKNPADRPSSAESVCEALGACIPLSPWSNEDAARWWKEYDRRRNIEEIERRDEAETFAATLLTSEVQPISRSGLAE